MKIRDDANKMEVDMIATVDHQADETSVKAVKYIRSGRNLPQYKWFKNLVTRQKFDQRLASRLCIGCGERHLWRNCPKNPKRAVELRSIERHNSENRISILSSSVNKLENQNSIHKQLYINGKVNNEDVQILVDTGSQVTLVDSKLCEEHGTTKIMLDNPMNIHLADGGFYYQITHKTSLVVKLHQGLSIKLECYIAPIGESIIIGNDWLRQHNGIIYCV